METAVTMALAGVFCQVRPWDELGDSLYFGEVPSRGEIPLLRISPVPTAVGILATAGDNRHPKLNLR
ncbi:hypothetical protein EFS30_10265 [Levilactobacillus parabrevis]|nr:hypothetical protein [Levilactobacillus parabrevis]MCT4490971.1 hypothetical protein [Levilactobacillus parabrevis]